MTITTEILNLTPDLANSLLLANKVNRPMSETTVKRYEGILKRGEWMLNGESLIIFSDNTLGNGQHRCEAVRRTGISIQTVCVRGINPPAFATMDQGKVRGAADVLAISGQKHYTKTASAARAYLGEVIGGRTSASFSPTQIKDCVDQHPHIALWVAKFVTVKAKAFPSMLCGYLSLASEKFGFEKMERFFDPLISGENLKKSDPAYLLRERFLSQGGTRNLSKEMQRAYIIKAINAHLLGQGLTFLRYSITESPPELISVNAKSKEAT